MGDGRYGRGGGRLRGVGYEDDYGWWGGRRCGSDWYGGLFVEFVVVKKIKE